MRFYPDLVNERLRSPSHARQIVNATVDGTSASFVCGSYVEISLRIGDTGSIDAAGFRTNGCGFMIAAADVLADWLVGKSVTELHGLSETELAGIILSRLGLFPDERHQCSEIVFQALRKAMAAYREQRIEEFQGEVALICTCFGVSEDTILDVISTHKPDDVDEVADLCRAGSGCGSCRMLIQELIDAGF